MVCSTVESKFCLASETEAFFWVVCVCSTPDGWVLTMRGNPVFGVVLAGADDEGLLALSICLFLVEYVVAAVFWVLPATPERRTS